MIRERFGHGLAPARAALAGNPSDGYGGSVLATVLPAWSAEAWASPADRPGVTPASALVQATVRRFGRELVPQALHTSVCWKSAIPRNVGLAGSSALVIAVLRALSELFEVLLEPRQLAMLALAVEVEDLGIVAGPQDRVAQAFGGLTFMDFGSEQYEPLDPDLLPPLLIAWRPDAGGHSGQLHAALRARYEAGEPGVLRAVEALAAAARQARTALLAGDLDLVGRCMDESLDLRREMLALDPRCLEMVGVARRLGASVNYAGSGGAIVAACSAAERLGTVEDALAQLGCQTGRVADHNPVTSG